LQIDVNSTYALYGTHPNVRIPLYNAPLKPTICGVNVFCFFSPSFFEAIKFNISSKNGYTTIPSIGQINQFVFMKNAHIPNTMTDISNKLLLKLSKILNFESIFSLLFNHLIICQSPLVQRASLFIKLAYLAGYPSINMMSVASPHLR